MSKFPNYCPGCGKPVYAIIGVDDDCVHCGVWWHDKCLSEKTK